MYLLKLAMFSCSLYFYQLINFRYLKNKLDLLDFLNMQPSLCETTLTAKVFVNFKSTLTEIH